VPLSNPIRPRRAGAAPWRRRPLSSVHSMVGLTGPGWIVKSVRENQGPHGG